MSNRTKATKRAKEAAIACQLHSIEELTAAVSNYATLEMTLESLTLEADAELKQLSEKWQTRIAKVKSEMADLFPQIETFTRKQRAQIFKPGVKTATVAGHELSLHFTPPKVDTKKGCTQKGVLAALIEHEDGDWADNFIRWTESLNKEAILDAWNPELDTWKPGNEKLGELGIEITKEEQFSLKTRRVLGEVKTTKGGSESA